MPPQRPQIVFQLAAALHRLLQRALSGPHYDERQVVAGLLTILSDPQGPFRKRLLFRDFDQHRDDLWIRPVAAEPDLADAPDDAPDPDRPAADPAPGTATDPAGDIFRPALDYVILVLCHPLTLANNREDQPTNMHVLLRLLAAHGPTDQGWPEVRVARAKEAPAPAEEPWPIHFDPVARTLAAQVRVQEERRRRGAGYGPISARRRAEHGPFWLSIPDAAAEVAEELTLWDCLAAVPVPLGRDLDEDSLTGLTRVLESLNERYGLLRSCGLDPEQWHDDEYLSIDKLKTLKRLRKAAQDRLRSDHTTSDYDAYRLAFAGLQEGAAPLAGFASFLDFAQSPVGQQVMHRGPRSLDESLGDDEGDGTLTLGGTLAAPSRYPDPQPPTRLGAAIAALIADCPLIREHPVLDRFAQAVFVEGRPIQDADGILADPAFRRLLQDTRGYPANDDAALLEALQRDLHRAIRACGNRSGQV